jgi:transcriptional regulator with XRE-family HTH domain
MSGAELRELRERAGVTARDLAVAINRDQTLVSKVETGHRPVPADFPALYTETLERITRERAIAFGIIEDPALQAA